MLSLGLKIEDVRESFECDLSWRWRVHFMTSVRGEKHSLQRGWNTATKIGRAVHNDET
jgi:hypothetical protein